MFSRKIHWLVLVLMAGFAVTFLHSAVFPMDDHFNYQAFIQALASGNLDLTISGFHGSDFLAVPLYWVFPSPILQIYFQIAAAILLPLCAYAAAWVLYKTTSERVVFVCVLSMMPFLYFVALRGWTGPAYWDLLLLSIAAAPVWPYIGAVLLALAILTKPFAIALLPLFFVLLPKQWSKKQKRIPVYITVGLCVLYMAVQYMQAGQIIIGSHSELNQFSVWQRPKRIFLNLAHSLQILFSVHNYYYPDPSLTGPGNMMHTTPILVFLGLFALTTGVWEKVKQRALGLGFGLGIGLNALLDHMDHFYMQAGILCLIIASIPLLMKHRFWIPLVLATLHFQWFYFYLEYKDPFSLNMYFFLVPAIVDVLFLFSVVKNRKTVYAGLRNIL